MSTQQAYIEGFVKKAAEYGYSETAALNILKEADLRGVIDYLKQGYGNLKNRFTGGSKNTPISPSPTGYDYPIGPAQPDNPYTLTGGNQPNLPTKPINLGTNLTGEQPTESPAAALIRGVANNSSLRAGLQGARDNWQATKPKSAIREALQGNFNPSTFEGNSAMNMLPGIVRVPLRGALAVGAGGYAAGKDMLNKTLNTNPQ